MEINSFMSAQVAQIQQTLQMGILDQAMNQGAAGAIEMLNDMSTQQTAQHPYKGQIVDVQV
ncbi:polyribonucleotide nucleotidyltransferase [Lysinibacillus sp. KU-BSD001]|uniref:polyribonucleotide nucleotidyltransferase n=1 Tax=Lysinibacillus sp. KU-BSD001 TaxID=3141328 RepID=UPI0036E2728C